MAQNVAATQEDFPIPAFYQRRPRLFIEHVAKCMSTVNEFSANDVVLNSVARREFFVKSSHSDVEYKVHFGSNAVSTVPCTFLADNIE